MAKGQAGSPVSSRYDDEVAAGRFQRDPAQQALAARLDRLDAEMAAQAPANGLIGRLLGKKPAPRPHGLYIHGAVGRGKTALMDLFFEVSSEPRKQTRSRRLRGRSRKTRGFCALTSFTSSTLPTR
jgi:cell division protein ZapE